MAKSIQVELVIHFGILTETRSTRNARIHLIHVHGSSSDDLQSPGRNDPVCGTWNGFEESGLGEHG